VAGGFRRRIGANERGAEALEFALVLPVFFLLVFGIVDFGYMINHDTMINNASREGAREGSQNISATALNDVKCVVRQALSTIETPLSSGDCAPAGTKIQVFVTCLKIDNTTPCTGTFPTDAVSGGTVVVKVDYAHSWITPVGATISRANGWPANTITLSKTTKMRIE
jgi:Flp pilus assembly protein TadG